MLSTTIAFTEKVANYIVNCYKDNNLFKLRTLSPREETSRNYRIEVYSNVLRRSIICTDFEDFYITLQMLENLEN